VVRNVLAGDDPHGLLEIRVSEVDDQEATRSRWAPLE
jgi:hypothetical protein